MNVISRLANGLDAVRGHSLVKQMSDMLSLSGSCLAALWGSEGDEALHGSQLCGVSSFREIAQMLGVSISVVCIMIRTEQTCG